MDTQKHCQSCQAPLAADAPRGLCPACLMKVAMATGTEAGHETPGFTPPSVEELALKFPQLEVIELIGRGGMGAVYKARQRELDRIVALKILPPGVGDDAAFAERFSREAKALARLNHPGIVAIHDFGRADGLYFFVMEFVDGVNLRQLLASSRVSPREALAIVPQICDALQFAHDQGIVHRDIKPENILLDRRGRVKVADFGLAKIVQGRAGSPLLADVGTGTSGGAHGVTRPTSELTEAGKVMGTPAYMAPEQVEHPAEVDHRADIYALGVVFYQMLTGELPGKRIELPSKKVHIDVRLDEVVLRALEKKPELRYQQVSEVKTCVETIANSESAAAPSTRQVETQGSMYSWVGSFPKLNGPFVVKRGNRRVPNWPVIGINLLMGLGLICVVLPIMLKGMSFNESRANRIELLFFGLFAVVYMVRRWSDSLSALESQPAEPGAPLTSAPRPYRWWYKAEGTIGLAACALIAGVQASYMGNVYWAVLLFSLMAFFGITAYRRVRAAAHTEVAKPRQSWWTWSPLQSPEVGEICSHLTKAERNHLSLLGFLSAVWIVGTYSGIPVFIRSDFGSGKWIVASVWAILVAVTIPMLQRMARHLLCSTAWARERGFEPERLRLFSFSGGNLRKVGAVLVVGLGLVLAQQRAITSYLGLGSSPQPSRVQKRHPKKAAVQPAATFGPVIERVVYETTTGRDCFLDLETGRLLQPPPEVMSLFAATNWQKHYMDEPEATDPMRAWVWGSGADLVYGAPAFNHERGLILLDGVMAGTEDYWKMGAAPVAKLLQEIRETDAKGKVPGTPSLVGEAHFVRDDALPRSSAFRTKEGTMGVLQVIGFTDNPRGVKIRYKLVQSSTNSAALKPIPPKAAELAAAWKAYSESYTMGYDMQDTNVQAAFGERTLFPGDALSPVWQDGTVMTESENQCPLTRGGIVKPGTAI